ncbi:MAG: hypothetical protein AVDCRST_MAG04-383, partial [uncultured Acetobacteraceae bacterium]
GARSGCGCARARGPLGGAGLAHGHRPAHGPLAPVLAGLGRRLPRRHPLPIRLRRARLLDPPGTNQHGRLRGVGAGPRRGAGDGAAGAAGRRVRPGRRRLVAGDGGGPRPPSRPPRGRAARRRRDPPLGGRSLSWQSLLRDLPPLQRGLHLQYLDGGRPAGRGDGRDGDGGPLRRPTHGTSESRGAPDGFGGTARPAGTEKLQSRRRGPNRARCAPAQWESKMV